MTRKAVTLKDVALESGFSVMAVSYVLNGSRRNCVNARNRKRILDVAQRLNYVPNLAARQLVTRRNFRIGLLIDCSAPVFYQEVMFALDRLVFARGYRLQIGYIHNDLESIKNHAADFQSSGIESLVCFAHTYPGFGKEVLKSLEPFRHAVLLERPLAPTRFPVVATDHYANYRGAVAGLLARGRRRILSLRGDYRDHSLTEARRGFNDAFREAGVPREKGFWREDCAHTRWNDPGEAEAVLDVVLAQRPDALVLANDEVMFRALRMLQRRGLAVPDAIALFSVDSGRYGALCSPSFSGIEHDVTRLAERIADLLFRQIDGGDAAPDPKRKDGKKEAYRELVPARFMWRASTGDAFAD